MTKQNKIHRYICDIEKQQKRIKRHHPQMKLKGMTRNSIRLYKYEITH